MYDGLFTWVVSKLKDTAALDKTKPQKSIGILDISGFENLNYNSLEQLCINYSNEKALKLFIHSYFEEEKALFQAEGLNKYISDNKPKNNEEVMKVIDNSKGAPKGVFQKLEDCITFDQNYGSFTVGIADALKNSPLFSKSKTRSDKFTIIHSCYPVEYTAKDFVDKVKDELPSNLLQLINKSNPTMGSVITKVLQTALDNNKMINYCEQFRMGINSLITELEKSRCNFVRCIKPNQQKASATWETDLVLNQIKTLGMSDYLSLKKRMYPLRVDFTEFCKKYLELNTKENQMYYELEANPATNFKDLAKQ